MSEDDASRISSRTVAALLRLREASNSAASVLDSLVSPAIVWDERTAQGIAQGVSRARDDLRAALAATEHIR